MNFAGKAVLVMSFAVECRMDGAFQFGEVVRTELDPAMLLCVGPESFGGGEFRGIGREVLDVPIGRADPAFSLERGPMSWPMGKSLSAQRRQALPALPRAAQVPSGL